MNSEEMAVKITEIDQRSKSNTHRVAKLEEQTEAIQKIASSVEILAREQHHQTEAMERIEKNVTKLDGKVEALENKPAEHWDNLVEKILWLIAGGIITFAFAQIGVPL